MRGHSQRGHTILHESFVAHAIELAFAGDASELSFKFWQVEWHTRVRLQALFKSAVLV